MRLQIEVDIAEHEIELATELLSVLRCNSLCHVSTLMQALWEWQFLGIFCVLLALVRCHVGRP